jgi:peptidoglycan/xylan/chitin deacetylase (PgdA/CDA1 family)
MIPPAETAAEAAANPGVRLAHPLAGVASAFQRAGAAPLAWIRTGGLEPAAERPDLPMPRPTVSVIMPCRDGAATLPAALRSLARQSFKDWEAIVVDDGSEDQSAAIAERWARKDPRVSLARGPAGGVALARNVGLRRACGAWLLFLDCDDWLAAGALDDLLRAARRRPTADVVAGQAVKVAPGGRPERLAPFDLSDPFGALCCEGRLAIHSVLVRREAVLRVGGFDASLRTHEDWDLWQRIARSGAIFAQTTKRVAFYRNMPQSLSKRTLQVAVDGLTVMRRGHGPDPRLSEPPPAHANGAPADALPARELFFLLWCAARDIAAGGDGLGVIALGGPTGGVDPEPRSLGELMAGGMADVLSTQAHRLGRLWPVFEPRLLRVLEAAIPHLPGVREMTLGMIKGRLNGARADDGDVIDLGRPLPLRDGMGGVLQLRWKGRTLGVIAVPSLDRRSAADLAGVIERQTAYLPLRLALAAARPWRSVDFWRGAVGGALRRLANSAPITPTLSKCIVREALAQGLQAAVAGRLKRLRPRAEPDLHHQALAQVWDAAIAEARALPADVAPLGRSRAEPRPALRIGDHLSVPVLMYHRIASRTAPGLERHCVSPELFEAQLRLLRREGYQSIGPEDLIAFLRFERGLPPRPVMLTFDDAYLDFARDAWPRLRRHGFSATVFAISGCVGGRAAWDDRYGEAAPLMDWGQLRDLSADGVAIESHGDTHRPMTRLPAEALYREAIRSRVLLGERLGRTPSAFCYPFGASDPASESVLQECGYQLAFTTEAASCRLSTAPMRVPRIEVAGGEDLEVFARKFQRTT